MNIFHNFHTGSFKDNQQDGKGEYLWTSGKKYIGDWKNGVKEGHGKMIWTDGTVYNGSWKNGKRHGFGVIKFTRTGNVYEGEWLNGKQDGKGKLLLGSGDYEGMTLVGTWRNGEYQKNMGN